MEEWKDIKGYEGLYSVSADGHVWSCHSGRVIKGSAAGKGYRKVVLAGRSENPAHRYVHEIVLETFIGPRPKGMEACHCNGKRDDNRAANLRWDTRTNNHADKIAHGTHCAGEKHYASKLTPDDVRAIRAAGGTLRSIGDRFGVGPMQIHRIKNRQNWSHLS